MPLRAYANLLLGRPAERPDPLAALLAAPTDVPSVAHGASWLVQLRWVATAGQLAVVVVSRYLLGVEVPLVPLLAIVAVTAASNLALAFWSASRPEDAAPSREPSGPGHVDPSAVPVLGTVMLLDLLLLTGLLFFTGGPANPFYVFYFVNLCLTAVVLPRRWAWAGNAVAVGGFVLLFFTHRPLPALASGRGVASAGPGDRVPLGQWGLLAAFVTCSLVVVYFTSLLRDKVQRRERQLRAFQAERARTQKLEALGTLAAGAAHELANPLATIAVVAREVERRVAGTAVEPRIAKDIALIRSELDSCRSILNRMSADAGQAMGERLETVAPGELLDEILSGVRESGRVAVAVDPAAAAFEISVPVVGLAQAVRGIVQNALTASASTQPVGLTADRLDGQLRLTVRDEGVGMPPAVLARVGDPFFTTKDPGSGTGLGVFLARAVVERLGGRLTIESAAGRGTTVTILLPAAGRLQSSAGRT